MIVRKNVYSLLVVFCFAPYWACSDDESTHTSYDPSTLTVETYIGIPSVAPGIGVDVTCTVTHLTNGVVQLPTVLVVEPPMGIAIDGHRVTPQSTGTYAVRCALKDNGAVVDPTPAMLLVTTGGAVSVETQLAPATIKAGETAQVQCVAKNAAGAKVSAPTQFDVEPTLSATVDSDAVSATKAGEYLVRCALADNPDVVDPTPAILTVVPGDPAKVVAIPEVNSAPAGSLIEVDCDVVDGYGNPISTEATEVSVEPTPGVSVNGHTLGLGKIGKYSVECSVVGYKDAESVPADINVTFGPPKSLELTVNKVDGGDKPTCFGLGDTVAVSWVVYDTLGNEVVDADVNLTVPPGAKSVGGGEYVLETEGVYTFTASLAPPNEGIAKSVSIYVDSTKPKITITYPNRGATLTGSSTVEVTGTVVDTVSGVKSLTVAGALVTPGPNGSFSFKVSSNHGMNIIDVSAEDHGCNAAKTSVTYYYSTAYQNYENVAPADVALPDSLQIFLGQEVLDDGVHNPQEIDDFATLIELLLATVPLTDLIGGVIPPIQIPNLVNTSFNVLGTNIQLTGGVVITPVITNLAVSSSPTISLQAIAGGIDASGSFPSANGYPGFMLTLALPIDIPIVASATVFGIPVSASITPGVSCATTATIDSLDFAATFLIDKTATTPLLVSGQNLDVGLNGFQLVPFQDCYINLGKVDFGIASFNLPTVPLDAITGPIGSFLGDIISPLLDFILPFLTQLLEPVLVDVGAQVLKGALESLELSQVVPIPPFLGNDGAELTIWAALASVQFTPSGGKIGMKAGAWAEPHTSYETLGVLLRDHCLGGESGSFAFKEQKPMGVAAHMDLINELLFSAWYNNLLSIAAGPDELASLSPEIAQYGLKELTLDALLPPIVTDCNGKGLLRLQMGETFVTIDMDFAGLVIDLEAYLSLEADIEIVAMGDELSLSINGLTEFHIDIVNVNDAWIGQEATLEQTLIAVLKPQIEKLTGDSLGSFPIPAIDLSGLLEGIPQGTEIKIGDTATSKSKGYLVIEGDLK